MKKKWIKVNSLNLDNELKFENLNPHPLQSMIWGEARKNIDKIEYDNYIAYEDSNIIGHARVEKRKLFNLFNIAWIPKGPTFKSPRDNAILLNKLIRILKKNGYVLLITDNYIYKNRINKNTQTILVDLQLEKEKLLENMHSNFRYGIRRARREKIEFTESATIQDIKYFYDMCFELSKKKVFELPGSEDIMISLVKNSNNNSYIQFKLVLGKSQGEIACGAILAKCKNRLHYIWGASKREFSKYGVNEALQWNIMSKGKDEGATLYDLEGIDKQANPGVFKFKNKFGGKIIALEGIRSYPLNLIGYVVNMLMKINSIVNIITSRKRNILNIKKQ